MRLLTYGVTLTGQVGSTLRAASGGRQAVAPGRAFRTELSGQSITRSTGADRQASDLS
jgi:hypothetical protein